MAKRGQPSYRPGELDRVRGRLGPLAEEEAKRMACLLGGEVGTEATDAALEASYQRLRRSSTAPPAGDRKGVGPARKPAACTAAKTGATAGATSARGARRSNTAAAAGAADGAPPVAIELGAASQLGYRDRVKIDFWAARHGYRLKSLSGAVAIATARANSAPVSVLCLRVAEEGAAGERASATAVDATAEADGDDAEQRGALRPARPATLRAVAESLSVPAADAGAEIFRESAYVLALVVPGHDYLSLARLAQGWLARLDSAHPAVATVAGVAEYRGVANEAELLAQATAARRLAGREQARLGLSDPRSGELRVASLSDQEPVEGVEGQ